MIYILWLLNNRFTALPIEEYIENSDLRYICFSTHSPTKIRKETFPTSYYQCFQYLWNFLVSASFSRNHKHIKIVLYMCSGWLDRATNIFINRSFVEKHCLNTCKLSRSVPVSNINGTPKKTGQMSEVVEFILHYKTCSEQTLFAVSSLSKQDLILRFIWLKKHNSEMNWQKGMIFMTYFPTYCSGCQDTRKVENLRICYNSKLSLGCNLDKDLSKSREMKRHSWENNEKNMRRPLLLYEVLTDITWEEYKVQKYKWNKPYPCSIQEGFFKIFRNHIVCS